MMRPVETPGTGMRRFARLVASLDWLWGMLIIAGLGFWLFQGNFSAQWSPIDDHQLIFYIGPDGEMSLNEIPSLLLSTEIGQWGNSPRYRPSYFFVRLFEMWLWGDDLNCWYAARVAMFIASFCILFWLLRQWMGAFHALVFVLITMGADYWGEIFARLGPAETYTVLGSALYALGFVQAVVTLRTAPATSTKLSSSILMLAGAFLAIGSKENFLPIALLSCGLLGYAWARNRSRQARRRPGKADRALLVCTAVIVAYSLFVASAIASYLASAGADVYLNNVSVDSRSLVLKNGLVRAYVVFRVPLAATIFTMAGTVYLLRSVSLERRKLWRRFTWVAVGMFSLILFYVFQFVFYNGNWPQHGRYDFPGSTIKPFVWLIFFGHAVGCLAVLPGGTRWLSLGKAACLIAYLVIAQPRSTRSLWLAQAKRPAPWVELGPLVNSTEPLYSYATLRQYSFVNSAKTRRFTEAIQRIAAACRESPDRPVLFLSQAAIDFETLHSTKLFLNWKGVANPVYLTLAYTPETVEPDFDCALARKLVRQSQGECLEGEEKPLFSPISALHTNSNPLTITFTGELGAYANAWQIVY